MAGIRKEASYLTLTAISMELPMQAGLMAVAWFSKSNPDAKPAKFCLNA
jgi:hypothetical protein